MRLRALLLRTAVLGMLLGTAPAFAVVLRGSTPAVSASPFINAEAAEARAERWNPAPVSFPFASPPPPNTPSSIPITFGQPTIAGIQGTGFEPDLRIDPSNTNRLYASVPGSLSSTDSWIWRSFDSGKTWKWVTASHPKVGKPVACPGGGDTELALDSAGRLYFNDLTLANFSTSRSDDQGTTFMACSPISVPNTVVDRQWYAVDGDPTALGPSGPTANSLYLANNVVGQGAPQCPVSGAGNNVLVIFRSLPGPLAGLQFGPAKAVTQTATCEEGIMGNVEVSPVATTTDQAGQPTLQQAVHHVYIPHDDATFSKIRVGRCFPVPTTTDPSGVLCSDHVVADLDPPTGPGGGNGANIRTGANFPSLAIDNSGNLYIVWQQAPVDALGNIGNTSLRYAYSTNEGTTWSAPITIPTPGLMNSVYTHAAAGDDGLVDITFYGTPATVTPPPYDPLACAASGGIPPATPRGGPDFVNGVWSLYMVQTRNGHDPVGVFFTPPILAGEHHNHRGTVASVIGGLCGDRTGLGDFFQFRIGPQGEANIIYSDSNNANGIGHTMFVRQNSGPGVYASQTVSNDPVQLNSVSDPADDGRRELDGLTSANLPNLDILSSTFTKPSPATCHPVNTPCYRVKMTLSNLSLAAPGEVAPDNIVWLTQWLTPSHPNCVSAATGCTRGGRNFHVYAESDSVNPLRCFFGEVSINAVGGGVTLTYPPVFLGGQITSAACIAATGPNGTITIEVPIGNVSLEAGVGPFDVNRLFSVTASTMTLSGASDGAPPLGNPPDVIDVARSYDADFTPTAVTVRSFTAKRSRETLTLRWRTGSEAALVGFNVYTQRGTARVRMNRAMISAAGDALGHAYTWRGRAPSRANAPFWLQWVRADGTRAWYGPVRS